MIVLLIIAAVVGLLVLAAFLAPKPDDEIKRFEYKLPSAAAYAKWAQKWIDSIAVSMAVPARFWHEKPESSNLAGMRESLRGYAQGGIVRDNKPYLCGETFAHGYPASVIYNPRIVRNDDGSFSMLPNSDEETSDGTANN